MKKTALLLVMIMLVVFTLTSCALLIEQECEHKDENSDHKCDQCQEVMTEHCDEDKDNACDICDKIMCAHTDEMPDHLCDACGKKITNCKDTDDDHKCDVCGETLTIHVDTGRDHKCDMCGAEVSKHVDQDGDNACDVCLARMCEHSDADLDHLCDLCGKQLTECQDTDQNHSCDLCGKTVSDHKDEDGNNACDICGGTICEHKDEDSDHLCDLCESKLTECEDKDNDHICDTCNEKISECNDGDKNHKCDVCGEVLSSCKDADGDYLCDVCGIVFEDISYSLNVSGLETGTRSGDDINGKFTIIATTDVRTRTRTYDGVEYTKSIKIGSKTAGVKVNVPGDGKLSFLIQNGSSGANTQFVVIVAPDGTQTEIEFDGNNNGSPVVKLEIDVTEGEWTIIRKSGTIDIYYLELSCKVPVSPECGFELVAPGKTDYICNTELDFSGLRLNAVYESGKTDALPVELVNIDTSAVNMSAAGVYTVTVTYKEYDAITFEIKVYEPSGLRLGFDATEQIGNSSAGNGVYFNHSFKETYAIGEEFSSVGLSVTVIASCGSDTLEFLITDYDVSGFDSATKGAKKLTVSYEYETGKTVSAEVTVHVVGADYSIVDGVYMTKVDAAYDGEIGSIVDGYNMFSTIQQALDFLAGAEASQKKVIEVSAGKYVEKLEITIPNLTIKGAGRDVTVIEWNSLYGVPDASGYSQVTDSTASVAVRDTAINCTIENITISNYWNSVEVFDQNLGAGYPEHRALALLVQADAFIMRNCALLGYQDTVEFFLGRQYLENCYIAGTTDFIFGTNNTTFFDNCQIHSINNGKNDGGYITAFKGMNKNADDSVVYGAIFYQCRFTADEEELATKNTAIGRTWGAYAAVALINCEIDAHVSTAASTGASKNERYVSMNGILPSDATVQFVEYGNTGAGALTEAVNGMRMLTDEEAALYGNLAVVFGKVNGKVTYLDAWDPNGEVVTDDRTYYYFEQKESATGTSYTLDTSTNLAVGQSAQLGDMLLFAEGGKIAFNQNSGALNMKAGALLRFTVPAGSEVIVTAYPGYAAYTINGVGTDAATFSRYYAEETEVTILSIGDCYIFSVIVNPGEEAPEAPTLNQIKVTGVNVNYTVGTEFTLEGATLKAYYSDGSVVTVTDYECDYSAVNSAAEGAYDVVFSYGGMSLTVTVTYEDPNAGPEITDSTVLDFTTPDGLAAVENNKRVTITGSVRHNGGEIQIQGTISFQVKGGTYVHVIPYANAQYASYTVDFGNGTSEALNASETFYVANDATFTYTGLSNNYLCKIVIDCPVKDGKYVFGGSSEEGDVTGILESGNNITISGTFKTHSGGAQMASDSSISFILPAFAKMTIKGYDTNYGQLRVELADGTVVEMDTNACYVYENNTAESIVVTVTAVNVGTEEAPAYNKSYITYLNVESKPVISESTEITFGSEGNYTESGIDFSGVGLRDNGGNNTQISSGSFLFVAKEGAVIKVHGYPGYTSYTISDGTYTTEEITDEYYEYTVLEDGVVIFAPVNSNNYFYSITVTYPAGGDVEPEAPQSFEVTFGSEGNYKDCGIDFSGINIGDNGVNNSQVKEGSFSFEVKAGAVVTINGYPGYTSYTLGDGTTTTEEITAETYTYTAAADCTITITPVSGNNYFYSFSVTYS